jgi:hypothetical protein
VTSLIKIESSLVAELAAVKRINCQAPTSIIDKLKNRCIIFQLSGRITPGPIAKQKEGKNKIERRKRKDNCRKNVLQTMQLIGKRQDTCLIEKDETV